VYLYIQDIMVAPDAQGKGFGRAIVQHLLSEIPPQLCSEGILALLAVPGTEEFYRKLGFSAVWPHNTAMQLSLREGEL
jgi:GNAT superfamily N-acetyltransferase